MLSGSAASAAAADLRVPVVVGALPRPVVPVPVPHEAELPALAPAALVAPQEEALLLNLSAFPLPRVAVESEVRAHLQGRRSF